MKKLIFIISLIAIMVLMCTAISAEETPKATSTHYLVQSYNSEAAISSQAEGKSIVVVDDLMTTDGSNMGSFFSNVNDGDHIEIILAENIYTNGAANRGILINKAITLTVRYNGFIHVADGANEKSAFYVSNKNATLRLIGSNGADESGLVSKDFEMPTYVNGNILDNGNLDAYNGGYYVYTYDGSVYMENMRVYANSAVVYSLEGGDYGVYDNYHFVNCAIGGSSKSLQLDGGGRGRKIIEIDNCYLNKQITTYTVMTGSYVKDSILDGGLHMDCWDISGQLFEFENTTVNGNISTATGRTRFKFTDCTFDPSKLGLGSDGGGGCTLTSYKTATCTEAGSKITYGVGDKVGKVDTAYANENPALGHEPNIDPTVGIKYDSYLEGGIVAKCERCGIPMADENLNAEPLFTFLGFSTPEDGSYGIVASYIVNVKAIAQYEEKTGKVLSYGIVAGAKSLLGDKNPLDKDGNKVTLEKGSTIKAEITREYSSYDFVLKGMNESQLDAELVIATYVEITEKDGENVTKSVVYLQSTQKTENLSVISYNTISKE